MLARGGDGENGIEVAEFGFQGADGVFHLGDELDLAAQVGELLALLGECPGGAVALDDLSPLLDGITVYLDAGYDSQKTRDELASRSLTREIAHKGESAPIQAGQRWPVERTNAWHNAFNKLQRCYERREKAIDAFFDLIDAIITIRRLIREAWTLYRWDTRPANRPLSNHSCARPQIPSVFSPERQRQAGNDERREKDRQKPLSGTPEGDDLILGRVERPDSARVPAVADLHGVTSRFDRRLERVVHFDRPGTLAVNQDVVRATTDLHADRAMRHTQRCWHGESPFP